MEYKPEINTKSLCLCMIVKDESTVIKRALESVRNFIDYWIICDTGSTDNTPAIILECLHRIPGELHDSPWINFGHNRTEAVQLAQNKADYILIMDADMIVNVKGDFKKNLVYDSYQIRYEGDVDYTQPMLISGAHKWNFVGVTHEYIESPTAKTSGDLPELTLRHVGDGGNKSDKFERDIRLLSAELEKDPCNARNMFYLAQSYFDLGDYKPALEWYEKRIDDGNGWEEEIYYSKYQMGKAQQHLGYDWNTILLSYLAAYEYRPSRLEPIYEIVNHYRLSEQYAMGYLYSSLIYPSFDYPDDKIFINKPVYTFKLLLEHGVCAYSLGKLSEAIEAFNKVLHAKELPDWAHMSAIRGRDLTLEMLFPKKENVQFIKNKIKVLIPFRNPGGYFDKCIESLLSQDYENFELIFFDDGSSDGSFQKIPKEDPRVKVLFAEEKLGLGQILHIMYTQYCDVEDIVVHLDADDWLADESVLSHINNFYNDHDCWVMYGQFQCSTGAYGFCEPFASKQAFESLRKKWITSHIRTFKAGLYHKISEVDPDYSCMKNANGEWYDSAVDAAVMFPILELAGFDHVRYNERVLYVYNTQNEGSISNKNYKEQASNYDEVTKKRSFKKIENYQVVTSEINLPKLEFPKIMNIV